jgi:hypothetical protein
MTAGWQSLSGFWILLSELKLWLHRGVTQKTAFHKPDSQLNLLFLAPTTFRLDGVVQ